MSHRLLDQTIPMATKTLWADLSQIDKLDGKNYEIWKLKIEYMLEEQEISDVLTVTMEDPQGKATPAQGDGTPA